MKNNKLLFIAIAGLSVNTMQADWESDYQQKLAKYKAEIQEQIKESDRIDKAMMTLAKSDIEINKENITAMMFDGKGQPEASLQIHIEMLKLMRTDKKYRDCIEVYMDLRAARLAGKSKEEAMQIFNEEHLADCHHYMQSKKRNSF